MVIFHDFPVRYVSLPDGKKFVAVSPPECGLAWYSHCFEEQEIERCSTGLAALVLSQRRSKAVNL